VKSSASANISVTLDIANLMRRDLAWFVGLAQRSGVDPDEQVMHRYDNRLETFEGFEVFVDPKALGAAE
jgi:hypothetical protein